MSANESRLHDLLRCPESHGKLLPVTQKWTDKLNARIAKSELHDFSGKLVQEPVDDGLLTEDAQYLYPIRNGVVNLFLSDRIVLQPENRQ